MNISFQDEEAVLVELKTHLKAADYFSKMSCPLTAEAELKDAIELIKRRLSALHIARMAHKAQEKRWESQG